MVRRCSPADRPAGSRWTTIVSVTSGFPNSRVERSATPVASARPGTRSPSGLLAAPPSPGR